MSRELNIEVESVLDILATVRANAGRLAGDYQSFAERLDRLNASLQRSPHGLRVRPASIALNNLAISFRSGDDGTILLEEIEAVEETLRPLLEDPTLGVTPAALKRKAFEALRNKIRACPMCRQSDWDIEICSMLLREFPGEYRHPPPHAPIALLVCGSCGNLSMHRLDVLGLP